MIVKQTDIVAAIQAAGSAENYKLAFEISQRHLLYVCLHCAVLLSPITTIPGARTPFCHACMVARHKKHQTRINNGTLVLWRLVNGIIE
jgi:hypothetical protein